jgi:hypothetical protein
MGSGFLRLAAEILKTRHDGRQKEQFPAMAAVRDQVRDRNIYRHIYNIKTRDEDMPAGER